MPTPPIKHDFVFYTCWISRLVPSFVGTSIISSTLADSDHGMKSSHFLLTTCTLLYFVFKHSPWYSCYGPISSLCTQTNKKFLSQSTKPFEGRQIVDCLWMFSTLKNGSFIQVADFPNFNSYCHNVDYKK